jgi:circadian clock protein KaiC
MEEYVTDAVLSLDHRVHEQISTRRIRVVKYRGSHHGTNEYPFLIDVDGVSVLPVTSLGLEHKASSDKVSSGLAKLDVMLGGDGFFRGSTVLVSGMAGTGKTTMAAHFADAACRRGERCLYFLFEESPSQMIRNMRSAGIDLEPWVKSGQLQFHAERPSRYGLETHLALVHRAVERFNPDVVIIDPMTNLLTVGTQIDVRTMLTRLIDFLKMRNVTAFFTSLTSAGSELESTETMISSLMDTWVLATSEAVDRKRQRMVFVLKSRGMAPSDELREFRFTEGGIDILPMPASRAEGQ